MKKYVCLLGIFMLAAGLVFTACDGGGGDSSGGDDALNPSTIVFADGAAITKQIGSGNYTNAVSGDGDGAITYSSGTPGTATVDENTGEVTIVALGTTVITAVKAATATHETVTDSYTLTVTLTSSTIVFADGSAVTKKRDSGNYTNAVSGDGDGAITYSSGTPGTATVDENTGEVTPVAPGTTVITAVKAATETNETVTNSYTLTVCLYVIGDIGPSGVGIVFYTTDYGVHGLEAAPSGWNGGSGDPTAQWKTSFTLTGGTAGEIGTGWANTYTHMTGEEHPAAALCRAYRSDVEGDWFLPSLHELIQLYWQRAVIGGFSTYSDYWSSSEYDAIYAWYQSFYDGYQNGFSKDNNLRVRAIRAF